MSDRYIGNRESLSEIVSTKSEYVIHGMRDQKLPCDKPLTDLNKVVL